MQNRAARSTFGEIFAAPSATNQTLPEPANGEAMRLGTVDLAWLRTRAEIRAQAGPSCQFFFQLAGSALGSANDRPFRLDGGTWLAVIADTTQIEPLSGGITVSLRLPLDFLSRRLASLIQSRGPVALPIRSAAKMCLEVGRSCLSQPEPMNGCVAIAIGDSLVELAKLAVIEQLSERRVETVRETVRARIQSFVQRNLADPDLTIERIAGRMQCTKRYLHKVFSDEGQTLNQYIWAQRLERCRAELSRADRANRSITEIAFSCGFSNAAHFSRSFRARFGQPPRAYRQAIQQH